MNELDFIYHLLGISNHLQILSLDSHYQSSESLKTAHALIDKTLKTLLEEQRTS